MDNFDVNGDIRMTQEINIEQFHVKQEADNMDYGEEGLLFNDEQMREISENIKNLTSQKCQVCDENINNLEMSNHQENCWPRCPHCHLCFSSNEDLLEHKIDHELKMCSNCQCFIENCEWMDHQNNCWLTCTLCQTSFSNKPDLDKHRELYHHFQVFEQNQLPAQNVQVVINVENENDDKVRPDQKTQKSHSKVFKSDYKFNCGGCTRFFISKEDLIEHQIHNLCFVPLKCQHCGKTYQSQLLLKNHMLTHEIRPCPDCDEIFEDLQSLKKHQNLIHLKTYQNQSNNLKSSSRERFKCSTCSKIFVNEEFLQKHEKSHTSNNNDLPGQSKSKPQQVQKPKLYSKSKGPWFCELCSKSYPTDLSITVHHKNDHKSHEMIACTTCNTLMDKSQKYNHRSKCILTCTVCKMRFPNKPALEKHQLYHKAGDIFNCPYQNCQKSYMSRLLLKNHLITHQKHKCEKCETIFGNLVELQKHGKCQEEEQGGTLGLKRLNQQPIKLIKILKKKLIGTFDGKWYVCQSCSKSYPTKQTLFIHHNLVHKPPGQPNIESKSLSGGEVNYNPGDLILI